MTICNCNLCTGKYKNRHFLLYQEAAEYLVCHVNTIRNYIADGKFKSVSLNGGHRDMRIIFSSFHSFVQDREQAIREKEPIAASPSPHHHKGRRIISRGI